MSVANQTNSRKNALKMVIDRKSLLERFLRYVQIDTSADPLVDRYPSSAGQWELGRMLLSELKELGLDDA